ncbi:putative O-linked N-acetylglucosamine transferase, SPINDLY family; TPR domain protein [Bradyrhizobium sp. STM 3843]|uniref:O-linked N-acetylglucosamine transferase, SPINDLY family protein n=1 Tax=Bradyrhizobium sp. STM 3843 TaxID=551947 RepID=UPI000240AED6|nr:tetratricopeptide repeat protein [Bradyrhizobium sp. STM 3843]CCE05633.1 putative O-linked N-acetylglucosamine transferase, SPINDLY family; TPR domain protein [Bradyrhizobium sp. STM 3843]
MANVGSRAFQNARLHKKNRKQADALLPQAVAAYRAGRHAEAQAICAQTLALVPDHFDALHLLGVSALESGRLDVAEQALTQAVAAEPRHAEALANLGLALFSRKRYQEARTVQERAVAARPNFAAALTGLGNTLMKLGLLEEALQAHERALAAKPNYADAYCNRGMAQVLLNRNVEAVGSFDRALALNPRQSEALFGKGLVNINLRHSDDAFAAFDAALAIRPGVALVLAHRGRLRQQLGQFDQAKLDYDGALAIDPLLEVALLGHAQISVLKENVAPAMAALRKILEQNPTSEVAWTWLGECFCKQGDIASALQHFDRALEIKPDYADAITAKIFALDFIPDCDFAQHQAARHEWWTRIGSRMTQRQLQPRDLDPERIITIGYVSSDFRGHSAALAFLPVLTHRDRAQFRVACYSSSPAQDGMTAQCRAAADIWVDAWQMSDEELAARIEADQVDILVDLSGHSAGNRLTMFARKPAPIQVSAWGHPTGTGLPTIDYVLADPVSIPPSVRHLFAEQIHDLPCMITMDAIEGVHATGLPMLRNGYVTFGVFNRIDKISDAALGVWAEVMRQLPDARIVIKNTALDDAYLRDGLIGRFVDHGITAERIACLGSTSRADHLAQFAAIDISLDPFPQNGGASTWESLHMGVPVITKLGTTPSARAGGAVVTAIGLDDWVAEDDAGYLAIARRHVADTAGLARLRAELPQRIATSAAGNVALYTRKVEEGYRTFWRRYCAANA